MQITGPDTEDYAPIAPRGGLSPFSTTSLTWEKYWPLKPDVVLEGGNAAKDSLSAVTEDSLSLLTTHHRTAERIFTTTNATSAAMALAARLAARIMVVYPTLWPETVRALIAALGGVDRGHATRLVARNRRGHEGGLPTSCAALWVRRARISIVRSGVSTTR